MAVSHALTVLSWMEMSDEDQPAEEIWLSPEDLAGHFASVRERHAAGSGGDEVEQVPMWDNEDPATQDEIRRLRSV
jgi:hypothetical protein